MSPVPLLLRSLYAAVALLVTGSLPTSLQADPPTPSAHTAPPPGSPAPAESSAASATLGLPPGAISVLKELPAFQPGLWEYRRTVVNATSASAKPDTVQKCADPLSEIRRKMTEMTRKGCRILGMTHISNRYRSSWSCMMNESVLEISNVIRADGPTSYEDDNEARYGDKTTRTAVVATRLGDCPTDAPPADIARPPDAR